MKALQRGHGILMNKAPFVRLLRHSVRNFDEIRMSPGAINMMEECSQQEMCNVFSQASDIMMAAKRPNKQLKAIQFECARRLKRENEIGVRVVPHRLRRIPSDPLDPATTGERKVESAKKAKKSSSKKTKTVVAPTTSDTKDESEEEITEDEMDDVMSESEEDEEAEEAEEAEEVEDDFLRK